jgi:predicted metal-dependent phosphoesterase TrpH
VNGAGRIDLHAHTDRSDGTLAPEALAALAAKTGLRAFAVTDHDCTSGIAPTRAAATPLGVEVLDGCEISAQTAGSTDHLLAYAFDPADAELDRFLGGVREARERRNDRLFERMAECGVPVERAEVMKHVRGRIVGRPHFARAMVDRGHVPDVRTAFSKWLHDRGPVYVEPDTPPPEEAVRAAVRAHGVAVLAHPKQIRFRSPAELETLVRRLRDVGLSGIEVDHPSHDAGERRVYRAMAESLGLVASGGSDFHGENKPQIALGSGDGTIVVTWATWERLLARRR